MILNNILTAFRRISRKRLQSFLILLVLIIGLSSWIMISLWNKSETKQADIGRNSLKIYKFGYLDKEATEIDFDENGKKFQKLFAETPFPLADELRSYKRFNFPVARFGYLAPRNVTSPKNSSAEYRIAFTDPDLLKMFRFNEISGNQQRLFDGQNNIIINNSSALKYFGKSDVSGCSLLINNKKYTIVAVIRDIPQNYKMQFDFLLPVESEISSGLSNDWLSDRVTTYLMLRTTNDNSAVLTLTKKILNQHIKPYDRPHVLSRLALHHSYSDIRTDSSLGGNMQFLFIFSALSLVIIIISALNYVIVNLSNSAKLSMETAVRKTYGARNKDIIIQYLVESQIMLISGFVLSNLLVKILLPLVSQFVGKSLVYSFKEDFEILLSSLALTLFMGLVSGLIPGIYFARLKPGKVFSTAIKQGVSGEIYRKTMIFFQFFLSMAIIVLVVKINNQLNLLLYVKDTSQDSYTLSLPLTGGINKKYVDFRTNLSKNKFIKSVNINDNSEIKITIRSTHIYNSITFIATEWKKLEKDYDFEYNLDDKVVQNELKLDSIMHSVFVYFAIVTVLIALSGVFVFAGYITEARRKEIGIRKTFGADILNIYGLFIKEFMIIGIASSLAAQVMVAFTASTWLLKFSAKIGDFNHSEYVYPALAALLLILITVSYHVVRISLIKPAQAVREAE